MRNQVRLAVAAVTMALAVVSLMPGQGSAGASSANRAKPVTCSAISGLNDVGHTLFVSGCTGAIGKTGTIAAPFFSPSIISWAAGGQSTFSFNPRPVQTGICPDGATAFKLRGGKVSSPGIAGASGAFHATFCFDSAGDISLKPGTVMKF